MPALHLVVQSRQGGGELSQSCHEQVLRCTNIGGRDHTFELTRRRSGCSDRAGDGHAEVIGGGGGAHLAQRGVDPLS